MPGNNLSSLSQRTIVGTGLIALDAVAVKGDTYKLFAAGSSPNVLTILQTLGWQSFPVGKIGMDRAADYVLHDLRLWDVSTKYILQSRSIHTPVYVQRNGPEHHTFENRCPFCRAQFSRYTPLTDAEASDVRAHLPERCDVFYIERVTHTALEWAKEYKEKGASIYFEPNRIDYENIFRNIAEVSDIVKYSRERRSDIHTFTDALSIPLEIETWGKEGIRFRQRAENKALAWTAVEAIRVEEYQDACGAGDWLSAYLLHTLFNESSPFDTLRQKETIRSTLRECQRYSARNCSFEGARGMLYPDELIQQGRGFCPYCLGNP